MAEDFDLNATPEELVGLPALGPMPNKPGLILWFGRVHRELDEIEGDIKAKDGFLFFTTHTYSKEDLRQHRSFRLTEVLAHQIGHTVGIWESQGRLTGAERKLYIDSRVKVEGRVSALRRDIAARKSTVFEGVTHFLRYIMEKLPDVVLTLLVEGGKALLGLPPSSRRLIERRTLDKDWED